MSPFPAINSTLSPEHLAEWIAEKYDLSGASCRLLKTNMNDTYIISVLDSKYVLRVYSYNRRTRLDVSEELRLLMLLKEHGLSASYPIADTSGSFIQEIAAPEGNRFAVAFSFAEGGKIRFLTEEFSRN